MEREPDHLYDTNLFTVAKRHGYHYLDGDALYPMDPGEDLDAANNLDSLAAVDAAQLLVLPLADTNTLCRDSLPYSVVVVDV